MIRGGIFRGDQHKEQVRGTAIQRRKIDPLRTAGEDAQDALHIPELSMRNSHPLADRGGADAFPLQENFEYSFLVQGWIGGG